jgi:transcriptional regulator with XRE-family HTH domain
LPRVSAVTKNARNLKKLSELITAGVDASAMPLARVAELAGIHRSHLSYVLKGEKSLSRPKLLALCEILNISKEEILEAAGFASASNSELQSEEISAAGLPLLRSAGGPPLKVISDPRFFDSALFMWLLHTQPFRAANVQIDCELVQEKWAGIPVAVSRNERAIGFFHRRSIPQHSGVAQYHIQYWADLTVYKGYVLFARKEDFQQLRPTGEKISDYEVANGFLGDLKQRRGGTLRIVAGVQDVEWRLRNPLTPELEDNVDFIPYIDADHAVSQFQEGVGDLFVGGLPQNMKLRSEGFPEILNFNIDPYLFSLNSLICSGDMPDSPQGRAILWTVTSLWFQTVAQLKRSPEALTNAAEGILQMLSTLKINDPSITASNFHCLFSGDAAADEFFPEKPTDILDHLTKEVLHRIHLAAPNSYLKAFNERFE